MSNLAFSINFCQIKINLSGNTVWPQASVFLKLAKLAHFCLLTLNVNLARFARNVKWDFSIIFKHCVPILSLLHRGIFVWLEVSCVPSGKLHLSLFGGLEMALHRFSSQFVENSALQYEIFCWEKKNRIQVRIWELFRAEKFLASDGFGGRMEVAASNDLKSLSKL